MDQYRLLRRLPMWERAAAKKRLEQNQPLLVDSAMAAALQVQQPKQEYDEPDPGFTYFVPAPVRKLREALSLLGLEEDETDLSMVKRAYHKQALLKHPDKGGSSEEFGQLKEAYDTVVDFLS